MTLVPGAATGIPLAAPQAWRHDGLLPARVCRVFGGCASVPPPTLPALASAFAEYLLAWREAPGEPERMGTATAPPHRLHECAARLDAILRRAEQAIGSVHPVAPRPVTAEHGGPRAAGPEELARLEEEAAGLLAQTRSLLRRLETDRPAAQRARLALVAAWGRYDDALAALRADATPVVCGDLAVLAGLRDALVRQLTSARSLCSQGS